MKLQQKRECTNWRAVIETQARRDHGATFQMSKKKGGEKMHRD